ncbi:hypothetical protein K431DRAFT_310390 [Polychaeton citri CBS 116435]|uniref:Osmotin, thaumatin-like protein n=1 Tax=Polychaeton citri CBS 116435 TaxID=1314669 RepID=A0A9P4UQ20_9PEZI|nr:hypothetical protein K431DRAFT_310390 [Polychaeton citri CBS 116435]
MHSSHLLLILAIATGTFAQTELTLNEHYDVIYENTTSWTSSSTEWPTPIATLSAHPSIVTHRTTRTHYLPDATTSSPSTFTKTIQTLPVFTIPFTEPTTTSTSTTTLHVPLLSKPHSTSYTTRTISFGDCGHHNEQDCIASFSTKTSQVVKTTSSPAPTPVPTNLSLFVLRKYANPSGVEYEGKVVNACSTAGTFEVSCVNGCGSDTESFTITEGPRTYVGPAEPATVYLGSHKTGIEVAPCLTGQDACKLDGTTSAVCSVAYTSSKTGGHSSSTVYADATILPRADLYWYPLNVKEGQEKLAQANAKSCNWAARPTALAAGAVGVGMLGLGAVLGL